MKYKLNYFSFFALAILLFTSCAKQIEIEPRQSILTETAFSSRDNVNAAITGVYSRLKNLRYYGRDMLAVAEALSENGFATNKSGRLVNEAANVAGAHFGSYQVCYYAIAEINNILSAIPKLQLVPAVTTAERNNWEGQLLFLRALMYHDLARVYCYEPGLGVAGQDRGGLPIILNTPLTTDGALANTPARPTVDSMYSRIYRDLDSAIVKLTNPASLAPATASLAAAQALYARVALYNRDYTRAVNMSNLVLTTFGSRLSSAANYVGSWTSQVHPESLFEIRFANQTENLGVNESLQTTYTTLRDRGNTAIVQGFGDLVSTTTLLQQLGFAGIAANGSGGAFSSRTDDARNILFETGSTARGTARIECTKFIGKNGFPNLDNIPLIRVSEVLLTRAEARANATNRDGSTNTNFNLTQAAADLVLLKQNRYLSYTTSQATADASLTTSTAIINETLRQRRLEFAMEGFRWFDFKRTNGLTGTGLSTKIIYTDFRLLPALPQRELDNNPNMIQNFGY